MNENEGKVYRLQDPVDGAIMETTDVAEAAWKKSLGWKLISDETKPD